MSNYVHADKIYTADEFLKFVASESNKSSNENIMYELIDGQIYMRSAPNTNHMGLSRFMYNIISKYMTDKRRVSKMSIFS